MQMIDRDRASAGAIACFFCAIAALPGCATVKPHRLPPTIVELNNAVHSVSSQLELLRATQQATAGHGTHLYTIPHTGQMAKKITLVWSGPVDPAVKSVAQLVGYNFQVIGQAPTTPVLVSVAAHQQPAFSILQNMGWQAGDNVGVIVRPDQKMIAVTYKGQQKGGY